MNHVSHSIKIIFFLTAYFLNYSVFASSSYTVHCPEKIDVKQTISTSPPGWRTLTLEPNHYLSSITLYSGKPEEGASLKPDRKNNKAKWTFSTNDEIYIGCEYNQTNIQLTEGLPAHTISCDVKFDANRRGPQGALPVLIQCMKVK